MADFDTEQTIKRTRKRHQCFECRKFIEAGSEAIKRSGRFDEAFYTEYMHPDCLSAAIHYLRERHIQWQDGWLGLWEELAYFRTEDPEFTDTLDLFRECGWEVVAARILEGRTA